MQGCDATGQLEAGTAADTPGPTAGIECGAQLSQGFERWQVAVALDVAKRFRADTTGYRVHCHRRPIALFTQTSTHADRNPIRRRHCTAHHHGLTGADRLD